MEAQRLITMSLDKIASSHCQRGGINLHRNLLVASVLHRARTAYMKVAYQHIIASRKQKQGASESTESGQVLVTGKPSAETDHGAGSDQSMTHTATLSHSENKENSPPTVCTADKGAVVQGVENTVATAENTTSEEVIEGANKFKSTTNISLCKNADQGRSNIGQSALKRPGVNKSNSSTSQAEKRRRLRNPESDSVVNAKKAKLDIPNSVEVTTEIENSENSSEILRDPAKASNCVNGSSVTCSVVKPSDLTEPMQTESTQITSLVTIFNSGFSGLCSKNSSSESNTLSCATEMKQESVQIPSVIALTV